jgi:hypothetical protein
MERGLNQDAPVTWSTSMLHGTYLGESLQGSRTEKVKSKWRDTMFEVDGAGTTEVDSTECYVEGTSCTGGGACDECRDQDRGKGARGDDQYAFATVPVDEDR